MWGLNSRPWRYQHHALPTELTDQIRLIGRILVLINEFSPRFKATFTSHWRQADSIMARNRLGDHIRLDFRRCLGPPLFEERNAGLFPNQWLVIEPRTTQERQKNNNNIGEVSWFFLTYSLIRVLPNASRIDFNSTPFRVDLRAVLQEPVSMTLRYHTHIANRGNEHWPVVLLNFSMISILTLKSTLLLLLCGHPVSSPPLSVNYVICVSLLLFTNTATPQRKRELFSTEHLIGRSVMLELSLFYWMLLFFTVPTTPPYLNFFRTIYIFILQALSLLIFVLVTYTII